MSGLRSLLSWVGRFAIVLVLVLALEAAALFGGSRFGLAPAANVLQVLTTGASPAAAEQPQHPQEPQRPERPELPRHGIMYVTDERAVNLADRGTLRYLKAQLALELATPGESATGELPPDAYKKKQEELRKELAARSVVINDRITMILSSKTADELVTAEGKNRLKQELKEQLSEAVGDRQLMNVYITQFLIQ